MPPLLPRGTTRPTDRDTIRTPDRAAPGHPLLAGRGCQGSAA